ncbi:MAG: hypothetical protein GXP62_18375 [Oligoflexia bacterium]|nr:hypothetical protein [Oligoflexia bacterium]
MKLLLLMSWCGLARAQDGADASAPTAAVTEPATADLAPAGPAPLAEPPANAPPTSDDEIDRLTDEISTGLRCPVCQGLSVNDSPAEGARSMKARVRDLVSMGYTGQQINDYFVERYGTWILLAPPAEGANWTVYLAPIGFLLVGAFFVAWAGRRRPHRTPMMWRGPTQYTPTQYIPTQHTATIWSRIASGSWRNSGCETMGRWHELGRLGTATGRTGPRADHRPCRRHALHGRDQRRWPVGGRADAR